MRAMANEDRYNRIAHHLGYIGLVDEIESLEKDRIYCKHDMTHFLDVARIAYIRVLEEKLDIEKDVVYAAALLHDIGRAEEYRSGENHDEAGARIAEQILNEAGYEDAEILTIATAIREHGSLGNSQLGMVLHDADRISRLCMRCKAQDTCKWRIKNEEIRL